MIPEKDLELKPYSAVKIEINTREEANTVLERILMSEIVLSPRKIDKPVILYGAGSLGKIAKDFFNYLDHNFLYFVDRNSETIKMDTNWINTKIIHPDEVKEDDKNNCLLIICIVTTPLISLLEDLKNQGWKDISFFYDISEAYTDQYPLTNGWFLNKPNEKEFNDYKKIFLMLDDVSRMHYLQFFAWRRLRIELLINNFQLMNNRYFIPELINLLDENEVFVDCGAFNGTISKKFIEITHGKYNHIYAIEADIKNYELLEKSLKSIPNVIILNCAIGDKEGIENFYQGFDYASKVNKKGNSTVKITTLDNLKIPASFIKMHLEGGELSALIGAKSTIRKHRPILAITIYHNIFGVREIPLFLMSCVKNYKYFMRLDAWAGTGAVFYAIPKERYN
ncbi:MAG: FkbM family methyltransferase [Promethearchaeota archaeon]